VLMDIRMPRVDGIEGCRLVRALPQPPEVLMLTAFDTDSFILDALEAGALGFMLKDTPPRQLVEAVQETAAGRSTVSSQVLSRLIAVATAQGRQLGAPEVRPGSVSVSDREQFSSQGTASRPEVGSGPGLDVLSAREREIAEAVARGLTNSEIAEEMFLSITTVKTHVASIFAKLEVTNRVQVAIRVLGA
ncbi:MAG: response regulator transcription factor, partial [Micrococcales bacterium]|nr:response regulator transcription factor [Micrococcales bacterium]